MLHDYNKHTGRSTNGNVFEVINKAPKSVKKSSKKKK